MDYRKLNCIIKKDKYPLPLINKIFRRIIKAKIFIKLDIRHAFYHIYIYPNLKELITFGIHYGAY